MSRYQIEVNIEARNRASKEFKQLERDINKVQRESQGAAQATNQFGGSLTGLANSAMNAVAAFGAMEIARVGYEMVKAGEAAVNTANRFNDLTGGANQAAAGLKTLREATRGMVSDTELMAGASRLLQMGIASSIDDAARLVEIAIALKQPSDSAAQAIENLSLMIANASYLRLDSLGLSATDVRDRVNELKEAGMGLQEAFAQAVIEQAADAMDRLGDSTEKAATAVSLLETRFANLKGSVDEAAFSLGEFAATYFEEFALMAANPFFIAPALASIGFEEAEKSRVAQLELMQASERAADAETRAMQARDMQAAQAALEQERRNAQLLADAENRVNQSTEFARQEMEAERELEEERRRQRELTYETYERLDRLQMLQAERSMEQRRLNTFQELETIDNMFARVYQRGIINEEFYRPQNLEPLNVLLDRYEMVLANAERLHERGIIDDTQLRAVTQSASEAERVVRSAEAQARAFQNVNLSTLLGEVSGGAVSEIGLQVSVDLIDNQLADEFTKELQRLTGERTVLTDYMEDTLVPMVQSVTEEYGAEAGARFAYGLHAQMMAGLDAGLSPQEVVDMIKSKLGFEYNFDEPITINVPAMVTWSNVIAQGLPEIIDEETGEALDQDAVLAIIEERLGLEEGVITGDTDRAIKYSLAGTEITIGDIADATGIAEEQLAGLMFNDPNNPSVDMTQPLSINLHSVGWGQVLDASGLTTQALLAQLPPEAVSIINGTPFIRPGQYQIAPMVPVQPAQLPPFTPSVPSLGYGMPTESPQAMIQDPMAQMALNAYNLSTDLQTINQTAAETDFSVMSTGMQSVADNGAEAYDNLTTLIDTEWVATVALDFVILDGTKWGQLPGFTNAVQDIMARSTRDNGGVPVGANQVNGR